MSDLYMNEESYYFKEYTCDIEFFAPPLGLLITRVSLLFVPGVAEQNREAG